jgi:hypothetical protein
MMHTVFWVDQNLPSRASESDAVPRQERQEIVHRPTLQLFFLCGMKSSPEHDIV